MNIAVYFAQMLKIFARTTAIFSALWMRLHPLHAHAVCLCATYSSGIPQGNVL